MKCSKVYIAHFVLLLLLSYQPVQSQDTSFDALVGEKMMGFTQRDFWQKPDTILAAMKIEPAEHVAEIGAGEGYFTLKLAQQVGPDGKLLALDEDDTRLNVLKLLVRYSKLSQVEIRQNGPNQLGLEPGSLDKVVMLKTYYQMENYESVLQQCIAALKPGGKIFIIDSCVDRLDNDKSSRKKLFKNESITADLVSTDLEKAGFNISQRLDEFTKQIGRISWFLVEGSKQ